MGIYARLGYNFDTNKFGGAQNLDPDVSNFLNASKLGLTQWQVNDLSSGSVDGYYENPYNDLLGLSAVFNTGLGVYSDTTLFLFDNIDGTAAAAADALHATSSSLESSLYSFAEHTNNLSGVTRSRDLGKFPDLNGGLSVGRQILNITSKTDNIQDNTPILGNFTSLYIKPELTAQAEVIKNDFISLINASGLDPTGNANNSMSTTSINAITSHLQAFQSLIDTRRNADCQFYQNSLEISNEYSKVYQFSNLGATQESLIQVVGSSKLHTDLSGNNEVVV